MILKIFKLNHLLGLLLIPIVAFLLCLPIFFNDLKSVNYSYFWEQQLFNFIQHIKWLNFLLTFIFIILNGVLLNRIFNKSHFFSKTTYTPAIIYLVLISFNHFIFFNPYLFEHLFLIILISVLLDLNQNKSAIDVIFKSGLLIGLLYCFSPSYLIIFPFGLLILLIIKAFNLKEWLVYLLGLSIPLIWFYSFQFLFDRNFEFAHYTGKYILKSQLQIIDFIQIVSFLLIGIINLLPLISYYSHNKVIIKKQLLLVSLLQFFLIVILIVAYNLFGSLDYSLIIPLSILIAINANNMKSDSFLSFLLTITLIINIVSLFIG